MGQVAIDPEHPAYERKRPRVFTLIAFERDAECAGAFLCDARENGFAKAGECADVLPLGRQHVDDVCRQAPQHAHGEVEPIRDTDLYLIMQGRSNGVSRCFSKPEVVFAACTGVYFVTATFFLPETKGKTLGRDETPTRVIRVR